MLVLTLLHAFVLHVLTLFLDLLSLAWAYWLSFFNKNSSNVPAAMVYDQPSVLQISSQTCNISFGYLAALKYTFVSQFKFSFHRLDIS